MRRPPTPTPRPRGTSATFVDWRTGLHGARAAGDPDFIVTPSGTRLPVTPKFKMSATARYAWPVGIGRAHVQAGVAHQGSASADIRRDIDGSGTNPNDFLGRIKPSTLVDLFAGFDWRNYNVELFATNIFDERNELSRVVVCSICTQDQDPARAAADDRHSRRREVLEAAIARTGGSPIVSLRHSGATPPLSVEHPCPHGGRSLRLELRSLLQFGWHDAARRRGRSIASCLASFMLRAPSRACATPR